MGDNELIRTIAEAFLTDMDKQIEQLRDYINSNDVENSAVQSHKIKGAALMWVALRSVCRPPL